MFRLFDFSNGSMATVFGIGVYGGSSKKWWHKAFVKPAFRAGNHVHRAVWAFRHRHVRRYQYNRIDTGLAPGYYDIDILMLNGMFALLVRYVELEMGGADHIEEFTQDLRENPDPNGPEGVQERQADRQSEAVALYRWWKETYPAMQKRRNELMHELYGKRRRLSFEKVNDSGCSKVTIHPFEGKEIDLGQELDEVEEKIDREEQEMLHRLVEIRRSLWT